MENDTGLHLFHYIKMFFLFQTLHKTSQPYSWFMTSSIDGFTFRFDLFPTDIGIYWNHQVFCCSPEHPLLNWLKTSLEMNEKNTTHCALMYYRIKKHILVRRSGERQSEFQHKYLMVWGCVLTALISRTWICSVTLHQTKQKKWLLCRNTATLNHRSWLLITALIKSYKKKQLFPLLCSFCLRKIILSHCYTLVWQKCSISKFDALKSSTWYNHKM